MKQKIIGFIYFVCAVLEIFIILRMVFKFFMADPEHPFVQWLYATTQPLVGVFVTIFPAPQVSQYILEFGSFLAMVTYGILAYALGELVIYISNKSHYG